MIYYYRDGRTVRLRRPCRCDALLNRAGRRAPPSAYATLRLRGLNSQQTQHADSRYARQGPPAFAPLSRRHTNSTAALGRFAAKTDDETTARA